MSIADRLLSEEHLSSFFVHAARIPYAILKLLPIRNKVVLISRNNTTTSIDFHLLSLEIKRQSPNTKVVILNHYMKSKLGHIHDILVEMYHLATSRACIIDSYVIAVSILKHKKSLIIVQIWHALGAIKQFGYMTLDKKLALLRKQQGLSQADVSERLDISRQAVSRWESGIATPSTENLQLLSKIYGVSLEYLLDDNLDEIEKKDNHPSIDAGKQTLPTPKKSGNKSRRLLVVSVLLIGCILLAVFIMARKINRTEIESLTREGVEEAPKMEFNVEW